MSSFSLDDWELNSNEMKDYFRSTGRIVGDFKFIQVDRDTESIVSRRKVLKETKKFLFVTFKVYDEEVEIIPFKQYSFSKVLRNHRMFTTEEREFEIGVAVDKENKKVYWKVTQFGEVKRIY
jgi:hypothetical protein